MALHPHLTVQREGEARRFTSPKSGRRDGFNRPVRGREAHAQFLLQRLELIAPEARRRAEEQRAQGLDAGIGTYLTFVSDPNFPLKFDSLDLTKSCVELCAVKTTADNRTQATVFVPDGKLALFLKRVERYRDENTAPRQEGGPTRPKHQDLVESISDIRIAALEALWTEEDIPFPALDIVVTWEVWLRRSQGADHFAWLRENAPRYNLTVGYQILNFVDRSIVLIRGTGADLTRSVDVLSMIAELRLPKTTAAFFTGMTAIEQQDWVDNLRGRLVVPRDDAPYICLFDTGVNHTHPLLASVISPNDVHAYTPAWGTDDRTGHGTPMAGLAAHGDLTEPLGHGQQVVCSHRLESVKIINPANPHDPALYGAVTQESAFRVEVAGARRRVFCMAISAPDGRDRGRPSSWSSAIDALSSGAVDGERRLMVLAAGNTDIGQRVDYPDSNLTDDVHDPAQAWNALAVGGYTEKIAPNPAKGDGWGPLAANGDLAPCSCTSMTWNKWPLKPDIVMEAGNMASHPNQLDPEYDDALQLLTTNHTHLRQALTSFGDTSAAAALAARYSAMAWAKYPAYWPETIRALLVHSASWKPAMRARFTDEHGYVDYKALLRCFGYGVPNVKKLMSSADNALTLISQGTLQPFFKENGQVKTRELRLHELPWPREVLAGLGEATTFMKVTLSYFIEPSPGARGWAPKYGYQSHGLRFAVRNPLETPAAFEKRINKYAREENYDAPGLREAGQWMFGHSLRSLTSLGSLHSDIWKGTAADLASRQHVAVYPTMGWWNKRPHIGAWDKEARYALIVSIWTPETATDLYTPVAQQIGVPVVTEIGV